MLGSLEALKCCCAADVLEGWHMMHPTGVTESRQIYGSGTLGGNRVLKDVQDLDRGESVGFGGLDGRSKARELPPAPQVEVSGHLSSPGQREEGEQGVFPGPSRGR